MAVCPGALGDLGFELSPVVIDLSTAACRPSYFLFCCTVGCSQCARPSFGFRAVIFFSGFQGRVVGSFAGSRPGASCICKGSAQLERPELQHVPHYPCCADQCGQDVREWCAAIGLLEHRQGPLVVLAIGGAARRLFDNMGTVERQHGVDIFAYIGGCVHVSVVDLIIVMLEVHSPVRGEARMIRVGLGFFKFVPRRDERPEVGSSGLR